MTDSGHTTGAARPQTRRLAVLLGMASAALSVSAVIIFTPTDGSSSHDESSMATRAEATTTPRPLATVGVRRKTPAATPTGTATPTPTAVHTEDPPADVATAGAQSGQESP